jgi:hypothetical protein
MSPRIRRVLLLLALPLAAFAAWEAKEIDKPASADSRSPRTEAPDRRAGVEQPPALPGIDVRRLEKLARRHASEQPAVDPFAAPGNVQSAKQAGEVAPPSPPAQAPPLPFRYIGQQEADGVHVIFLEQQEQVHIVRIGENVANGWRLDAAGDEALTFTYVPLGQKRQLPLGGAG